MLTRNQFNVLSSIAASGLQPQRSIAASAGISLGSVNSALRELKGLGMLDVDGALTDDGKEALEPYRVENAIIMAAGMPSQSAPLLCDIPMGLLRVRGEVLIERQVRQLHEAGIMDVIVVVGYMKERFFYLEDELGVEIRVSEDYAVRNNNSTLHLVRERLGNTYICSSDNYFTENVFEPYVYKAYYPAVFFEGPTDEYLLTVGTGKRITQVSAGGRDGYGMLGHAYFDRAFSRAFVDVLEREYGRLSTAGKLWEDLYAEHADELEMVMRTYEPGVIYEFDSLDELGDFDPRFIENVDASILDNICATLDVGPDDVTDIHPIKQGLTNLSFSFRCNGGRYVYRHPVRRREASINRESEAFSQRVARDLGLDETFIFEDPMRGWKIARYLDGCTYLDYHDSAQVSRALSMLRTLHRSGVESRWLFSMHETTKRFIAALEDSRRTSFKGFDELAALMDGLADRVEGDGVKPCLCHNDCYAMNILVSDGAMSLVDWEYSGMSDYASDLGAFICCSDYTYDRALEVLEVYFERRPSPGELAHCLAYIALASFCWFVWALVKDAQGASVGVSLYRWYRSAKLYGRKAVEAYEALEGISKGEA